MQVLLRVMFTFLRSARTTFYSNVNERTVAHDDGREPRRDGNTYLGQIAEAIIVYGARGEYSHGKASREAAPRRSDGRPSIFTRRPLLNGNRRGWTFQESLP